MSSAVVILRIYFNSLHAKRGFWAKVATPSIALRLLDQALKGGIAYALVTLGSAGFVRGARKVEGYSVENISERMPSCLELVGTPEQISRFLDSHRDTLKDTVIIQMMGTELLEGGSLL